MISSLDHQIITTGCVRAAIFKAQRSEAIASFALKKSRYDARQLPTSRLRAEPAGQLR
jgi:hypothetical protein